MAQWMKGLRGLFSGYYSISSGGVPIGGAFYHLFFWVTQKVCFLRAGTA